MNWTRTLAEQVLILNSSQELAEADIMILLRVEGEVMPLQFKNTWSVQTQYDILKQAIQLKKTKLSYLNTSRT